jgi:hypothetical protein
MRGLTMNTFLDILRVGNYRIELQSHEQGGFSVIFTALDGEDRRVIKAPVMQDGKIKIYPTAEAAILDAMEKFGSLTVKK